MRLFTILSLLFLFTGAALAEPLTLNDAISLAIKGDPSLAQIESSAQALNEQAVAEGQLPDPQASVGLQNLPVDDFSRSREGMTQTVVGISQSFPRGSTLAHKEQKFKSISQGQLMQYEDKKREIKRSVRKSWLDLYYWQQAAKTVKHSEKLLKEVIKAAKTHYSTGRSNAKDVIGAELELSVLGDKKIDIARQIENAKAELNKWLGNSKAQGDLQKNFPALPQVLAYEQIEALLIDHPKTKIADAMLAAGRYDVNLAEDQYKPGFNFGVNYGIRENRADMASAKISFDIPFFTDKRQDKNLSASKYNLKSAEYRRSDILRSLKSMLEQEYSGWQLFDERAHHYEKVVTKQANENFEAALRSYQEDRSDFSSLIRAQVMELDAKLQSIKLKVEKAKAQANLLYLQGEEL